MTTTTNTAYALTTIIRRSVAALAVTFALAASAGTASAEKIANVNSGSWKGGAYTNNATGQFSHCAANARYKSGIALFFSVTRKRQWSMGFANSHWELSPGNKYPVRFQVDSGPILKGVAMAKTQKMVQVHLPANNRLFRHFKVGGTLKVAAGSKVMRFNLNGTNRMLSKLYRCAVHFAQRDTIGRDPFQPASFTQD
ncbi:MAG: hypothetical protein AAF441_25730 [Pseudomonadota bacterium]